MESENTFANKYLETEQGTIYKYIKRIGYGGPSRAFVVESKNNYFIAKTPRHKKIDDSEAFYKNRLENFKNEAEILNFLKGKTDKIINIIESGTSKIYYETNGNKQLKHEGRFCLILEPATKGELLDYLNISRFPIDVAKNIFKKICLGVKSIHDLNVCHLDLKPDNILIDKDVNLKLIDFGFAKRVQDNEKVNSTRGTLPYAAIEIILLQKNENNPKYYYDGKKADIFALGIILLNLILRTTIEADKEQKAFKEFYKIVRGNNENLWKTFWQKYRTKGITNQDFEEFRNLFLKLCTPNISKRLNIDQILSDEYLQKGVADDETTKQFLLKTFETLNEYRKNESEGKAHRIKIYVQKEELEHFNNNFKSDDENIEKIFTEDDSIEKINNSKLYGKFIIEIKAIKDPKYFMNLLYHCIKVEEKPETMQKDKNLKLYLSFKENEEKNEEKTENDEAKFEHDLKISLNHLEKPEKNFVKVKLCSTDEEESYVLTIQNYYGRDGKYKKNLQKILNVINKITCDYE